MLSPLRNARFFRMLRTHLLCAQPPSGELEADRQLILAALREGRCYLGRDSLAGTRGVRFYGTGRPASCQWEPSPRHSGWMLHVRLPLEAQVRLIRDGERIRVITASALDVEADRPGVYRNEAQLNALGRRRTWIVSNPIYLRA